MHSPESLGTSIGVNLLQRLQMVVMMMLMMMIMMMMMAVVFPQWGWLRQMIHESFPCLITIWGILLPCLARMMMIIIIIIFMVIMITMVIGHDVN